MDMSFGAMWMQMGWFVRGIVIVMIGMSVVTISVSLAKWWRLHKLDRATKRFEPEYAAAREADDLDEALRVTSQHPDSHVAAVLGEALREVVPLLKRPELAAAAITSAERAVEREQIMLSASLKNGLGILATIGATAPFVGLLGTVIGIVNSFQGIAESGGGGLEAVSAGIAEALIATAIGLLAAIPAVWLYNYFTSRLENIFSRLAYKGRETIDWLMTREALRGTGPLDTGTAPAGR